MEGDGLLHGVRRAGERELSDARRRADDRQARTADPSPLTTRSGAVIASMLLNATIGVSFQRMFLTGRVTFPFSMRNRPSRVRPVTRMVCGSSGRMYQKRVDQDAALGAGDEIVARRGAAFHDEIQWSGGRFFPIFSAQYASRTDPSARPLSDPDVA